MATTKQLQKAALKAAAAIKTQAIQFDTCKKMGIVLSLLVMGCAAPAYEVKYQDKKPQCSLTKPYSVGKTRQVGVYTLKNGQDLPVYTTRKGESYVILPNNKKFYLKTAK